MPTESITHTVKKINTELTKFQKSFSLIEVTKQQNKTQPKT